MKILVDANLRGADLLRTKLSYGMSDGASRCDRIHPLNFAKKSQTTSSSSCKQGTFPAGEKALKFSQLEPSTKGEIFSSNGMESSCINTQGRNDQDK
jgi:hypothetical protein